MQYDKDFVAGKLRHWEKYLKAFSLPKWEEIPDLGLYMDQVLALLPHYLDYLPPELRDSKALTASTINNYVRMKVMPEPVKRKYYREHIAYLIMICTLKQTLSIATIQKMIPVSLPGDEFKGVYDAYVEEHRATALRFIEYVRASARPILDADSDRDAANRNATTLVFSSAIAGGFSRLLSEKLLLLEGLDPSEVK